MVAIILSPIANEFAAAGEHVASLSAGYVALVPRPISRPSAHHNNTLAMGIGSYRFSDFIRVGLPGHQKESLFEPVALYVFWV